MNKRDQDALANADPEMIGSIRPGDKIVISMVVHHQNGQSHELLRVHEDLGIADINTMVSVAAGATPTILEFMSVACQGIIAANDQGTVVNAADAQNTMGVH